MAAPASSCFSMPSISISCDSPKSPSVMLTAFAMASACHRMVSVIITGLMPAPLASFTASIAFARRIYHSPDLARMRLPRGLIAQVSLRSADLCRHRPLHGASQMRSLRLCQQFHCGVCRQALRVFPPQVRVSRTRIRSGAPFTKAVLPRYCFRLKVSPCIWCCSKRESLKYVPAYQEVSPQCRLFHVDDKGAFTGFLYEPLSSFSLRIALLQ